MSEKQRDPDKEPYEIVEVLGGTAMRRDGARLTLAKKNAWYVLATIHGEQKVGANLSKEEVDAADNLAAANRQVWNRWQCGYLSGEMRSARAESVGLDQDDLAPFTKEELFKLRSELRERTGDEYAELPSPDESINFSDVYFPEPCSFEGFIFERPCICIGAHFDGPCEFGRAHFLARSDFSETYFGGPAEFYVAHFDGTADFVDVYFAGDAFFTRAHFVGPAQFNKARFVGNTFFNSTHFADYAVFIEANFYEGAKFASTIFKSETFFLDARFHRSVPEFYGAELFEKTLFPTNANDDVNWPPRAVSKNKSEGQMSVEEQAFAYNRLQQEMNKTMRVDEEQFFHRMEMRCKGKIDGGAYGVMHAAFDAISEYGNNIFRPVGWLAVFWLTGTISKLKAVDVMSGNYWPDISSLGRAMGWSFANLFPLFGFRRLYFEATPKLHALLQFTGGVQTVAGFVLLFLLGLGLRNRFRLR